MTSTFRLIRAEFKKIFKKSGVYIMALFIVATIFLSLYIFQPVEALNPTIEYGENLTSQDYYTSFFDEESTDSLKGINDIVTNTDNVANYYIMSNNRNNNLNGYYEDIVESLNQLEKNLSDKNLSKDNYDELRGNIIKFIESFKDFSDLESYSHIKYTTEHEHFFNNYLGDINDFLNNTKKYDEYEILEYWDNNQVEEKLKNALYYSVNYISPTLYEMSIDMKTSYDNFNKFYEYGNNNSNLPRINQWKDFMKDNTKKFHEYFTLLANNDFPIILINTEDATNIISKLEEYNDILSRPTSTYSDYTRINDDLRKFNYHEFKNIFDINNSPVYQVSLKNADLENFEKIKKIVYENQDKLKEQITESKQDESINNIQFKITEYSLLAKSYEELINDSIILNLSDDFPSHEFEQMYSEKLKFNEFNKYQVTERITSNTYYINNNIYSNSFNTNFTFGQNSSTNGTNVWDFMYFAMELCTVIILIFAMLLVCSFVAGETDSGTIKLLLVRPFSRSKVLTAKLFATIFFVVTFMLFSSALSFAAGYFTYGYSEVEVFAIFNAQNVLVISPLALMAINILCLTIEVLFYVFVSLMIATICKNYAGSIYLSLLFVAIIYTLNILFGNEFWYSFLPGMNLHLFKYFGNSFLSLTNSSVLQSVLITPILSTMTFVYSALLNGLYLIITVAAAYSVFNKRDF